MVVRTLVFMIVRQVVSLIRLGTSPDAKDIEMAVLRHQLLAPLLTWMTPQATITVARPAAPCTST